MPEQERVLVVGTTTDYVEWLRTALPGEVIFITDPDLRSAAAEDTPEESEELLADLSDWENVCLLLKRHLDKYHLRLNGIACFDDEYMTLTAFLAEKLGLNYPPITAIKNCRNKYLCKTIWRESGVSTPFCRILNSLSDAEEFFRELESRACVLKPVSGSGSELTFRCDNPDDFKNAFDQLENGLAKRKTSRMYSEINSDEVAFLAEELVAGQEYSCDFMIQNGKVEIIRMTKKHPSADTFFGTTEAYELITLESTPFDEVEFKESLRLAAQAVGLGQAICMVDIIERFGKPVLLEIAPRLGGDCLPWLLKAAYNIDNLALAVDFARNRVINKQGFGSNDNFVGLRVFSDRAGNLNSIDTELLRKDNRVVAIRIPNEKIEVKLPPEDYFSRILGHVIYHPTQSEPVAVQNRELRNMITLKWE